MCKPFDFVQRALDLVLLKILTLELLHGWAIGQRLLAASGNVLQVGEGSLSPVMHKLEVDGWIKAQWNVTEGNRRAKFYSLTAGGRRAIGQKSADWDRLSTLVTRGLRFKEAKA